MWLELVGLIDSENEMVLYLETSLKENRAYIRK